MVDVEIIVTLLVRPLVQQLVRPLVQVTLVSQNARDTAVALLVLLTVERLVQIGAVADVKIRVRVAKVLVTQHVLIHVVVVRDVPDIAVQLVASVQLGVVDVKMLVEDVNHVKVELWEAANVSHRVPVLVV